jgi:hypothetical protein
VQDPQVAGLCKLVQTPSHSPWFSGQGQAPLSGAVQVPPQQMSPPVQELTHEPQWLLSVSRSKQPSGQQDSSALHAVPHAPQLLVLICKS